MPDHEDQARDANDSKNQTARQFNRRCAIAGEHHAGDSVFVEEQLVDGVEPVENREQGHEVEQPAVRSPHSSVPCQQEKSATNGEPSQPRAYPERENAKDKQDDSECQVFARKMPDNLLDAYSQ
jgi:hypothetical protein